MTTSPRFSPLAGLLVAVLVVSTAAILIRYAQAEGVGSLAISAWRLVIAGAILLTIVLTRPSLRAAVTNLNAKSWILIACSGFFLGAHIASWITSLAYTSVASSTALVTTNPIWLAIFSLLFLRTRIGGWMVLGIAASIAGSFCIFWADASRSNETVTTLANPTLGNALALLASMLVCGYLLIGRLMGRDELDANGRAAAVTRIALNVFVYAALVYAFAAVFLMIAALGTATPLMGFSAIGWVAIVGLALGPQLIGHTLINWSLKHLAPTFVAVAILGEPIGSAIWAFFLFDEKILPLQFVGFAFLIGGIVFASRESAS
jgi:drug/metabolite transporter (DMT)-like permease